MIEKTNVSPSAPIAVRSRKHHAKDSEPPDTEARTFLRNALNQDWTISAGSHRWQDAMKVAVEDYRWAPEALDLVKSGLRSHLHDDERKLHAWLSETPIAFQPTYVSKWLEELVALLDGKLAKTDDRVEQGSPAGKRFRKHRSPQAGPRHVPPTRELFPESVSKNAPAGIRTRSAKTASSNAGRSSM